MSTMKTPAPQPMRVLTPKEARQVAGGPMGAPTLAVPPSPEANGQAKG